MRGAGNAARKITGSASPGPREPGPVFPQIFLKKWLTNFPKNASFLFDL